MRVVVALAVTVGAVVLLGGTGGITGDDAPADGGSGSDCPWLTGHVTELSPARERNAKIITAVAQANDLGMEGAAIGVAASLAESNLLNLANGGDSTLIDSLQGRQLTDNERSVARRSMSRPHDGVGDNLDSVGIFQQRPMAGWGPPEILMDPAKSAELFFAELDEVPNWRSMSPWASAQEVQGSPSSDGEIYRNSYAQAVGIVEGVTGTLPDQRLPPDEVAAITASQCAPAAP